MRLRLKSICAVLVAFMTVPAAAHVGGRGTNAEERLIVHCIHRSARSKPWLEKTLRALRDQEGGWIGARIGNRNASYDLGPMQINSWWVPRMARLTGRPPDQVKRWLQYDPCFNVEAARWILLTSVANSGGYWEAVGRYHSPTPSRQRRYIRAIARQLNDRFNLYRDPRIRSYARNRSTARNRFD